MEHAAAVLRRAGSLQNLPTGRPNDDNDETGQRIIVQIRVLTSDQREFARIGQAAQKALQDAGIDGASFVLTDDAVMMTATEVKNVSQHVVPHVMHTLGMSGIAAAGLRQ